MSTRPTPVSNKAKIAFTSLFANDDAYWVPFKVACNLERGRDEAREQRDRLVEALRECRDDSIELLGERDWWQRESRGDYQERYQETRDNVTRADAALATLNQPTEL